MQTNSDQPVKTDEANNSRTASDEAVVCKELSDDWKVVSSRNRSVLPETDAFVSRPLLFIADGKIYAGHYHTNGWFYNEITGLQDELYLARGKWEAVQGNVGEHVWCEAWRYLRKSFNDKLTDRPTENQKP